MGYKPSILVWLYLVAHPTNRKWVVTPVVVGLIHLNWGELTHLRAVGWAILLCPHFGKPPSKFCRLAVLGNRSWRKWIGNQFFGSYRYQTDGFSGRFLDGWQHKRRPNLCLSLQLHGWHDDTALRSCRFVWKRDTPNSNRLLYIYPVIVCN